jgi:hypothetical protein
MVKASNPNMGRQRDSSTFPDMAVEAFTREQLF